MSEPENTASRPRGALRQAGAAISAILLSPGTYLVLYIAVIFGFAYLYDARQDAAFYAPYAKLEPTSLRDYAAVESNILRAASNADTFLRVDNTGWLVNPNSLHVSELSIDEAGDFSFTLSMYATYFSHGTKIMSAGGPLENIRVGRRVLNASGLTQFCRLVALPPDQFRQPVLQVLFKQQAAMAPPLLCWDGKAEYQFHKMSSGWSGNPKAFSGSYWRMLYLSAITITSVGYGDIVPISNAARLLCGLEAVLGWVIAGFFLSVVTIGRRRLQNRP